MDLNEALEQKFEELSNKSGIDKEKYIISTGFKNLDYCIGGSLNSSNLITISAVSGMGKTAFVTNIAFNVAKKYPDKDIVFFSFQKNAIQIATRILSSEAMICTDKINYFRLTNDDWLKLSICAENIHEISNLHIIDDVSNIGIEQMKDNLKEFKNIGLIVIDNLQLMATGFVISEVIRQIKVISQELNIPIILVSQLWQIGNRHDRRPNINDLKVIEDIDIYSDVIIFIYRDSYYNKNIEEKNICECIVSKNNNGTTSNIKLGYTETFNKFTNLETIEI